MSRSRDRSLDLPFDDHALESVSCLHVAEHIGLGRYGDPLDPQGTRKAAASCSASRPGRPAAVLAPSARRASASTPTASTTRVEVRELFDELELVEHAGVDDAGGFRRHRELPSSRRSLRVRDVPARAALRRRARLGRRWPAPWLPAKGDRAYAPLHRRRRVHPRTSGESDSPPACAVREHLVAAGARRVVFVLHPLSAEQAPLHVVETWQHGELRSRRELRAPSRPPLTYPLDLVRRRCAARRTCRSPSTTSSPHARSRRDARGA